MLVADSFGIIVGIVLGRRIPERFVKWGSACVFIAFGVFGIHENVPEAVLTPVVEVASLALLAAAAWLVVRFTAPQEGIVPEIEE